MNINYNLIMLIVTNLWRAAIIFLLYKFFMFAKSQAPENAFRISSDQSFFFNCWFWPALFSLILLLMYSFLSWAELLWTHKWSLLITIIPLIGFIFWTSIVSKGIGRGAVGAGVAIFIPPLFGMALYLFVNFLLALSVLLKSLYSTRMLI